MEVRLALAELDEAVGDHDARVAQALDLGADELRRPPRSDRGSWKSCVALRFVAMTLRISSAVAFTRLPLADVRHRGPRLARRQRRAALQQLDRDEVRRPDERHAAVARRARDRVARVDEALARGVDVVDLVRDVAEVAAARVRLGLIPVVGELDLRASPPSTRFSPRNTSVNLPCSLSRRRISRGRGPSQKKRSAAGRSRTRIIVCR